MAQLHFLVAASGSLDKNSFRPLKDESQWTGRRDALVRIAAAAKSSVFLFSQDYSALVTEKSRSEAICTEQVLLQVWRDAIGRQQQAGRFERDGWACELVKMQKRQREDGVDGRAEKRELLEWLQANCDLGFLKKHHLNSSANAILKKMNRAKLASVVEEWKATAVEKNCTFEDNRLVQLYEVVLRKIGRNTAVLILHEDYPFELNVFSGGAISSERRFDHIICFLGGVRDVSAEENKAMFLACKKLQIPLVACNLGQTAEFTSKIIYALHCHHNFQRLEGAVHQLTFNSKIESIDDMHFGHKAEAKEMKDDISSRRKARFYYILNLMYTLSDITIDLNSRSRFYEMIHVIVCSLWRSRVISAQKGLSDENTEDETTLILHFSDRTFLVIEQRKFLQKMAETHRIVPSENQIMQTILEFKEDSLLTELDYVFSFAGNSKETFCFDLTVQNSSGIPTGKNASPYEEICLCSQQIRSDETKNFRLILILGSHNSNFSKQFIKYSFKEGMQALFPMNMQCSIGGLIACVQHWNYHGVLHLFIQRAIK